MRSSIVFKAAGCLLVSCVLPACGGSGGGAASGPPTPVVTLAPLMETAIGRSEPLVLTFSESIATSTLILGGTMGPEATATWSTVVQTNDRVTITPTLQWTTGATRTLTVSAVSAAGAALTPLPLVWKIVPTVLYVSANSPSGSDAPASGSRAVPYRTIAYAIQQAAAMTKPLEIHVDEGLHLVATFLDIENDVSLIGGYSATWGMRDRELFPSQLRHQTLGTQTVLLATDALTAATVVDGFILLGEDYSSPPSLPMAASLYRATTFRNNRVRLSRNNAGVSYGIRVGEGQDVLVADNVIEADAAGIAAGDYIGIDVVGLSGLSATIERNRIQLPPALASTKGIQIGDIGSFSIRSNSIHCIGDGARGIVITQGTTTVQNNTLYHDGIGARGIEVSVPNAVIENNVIVVLQSGTAGIYEVDATSDPVTLRNNMLLVPEGSLYVDEGTTPVATPTALNALTGSSANSDQNPNLVSPVVGDLRLAEGSPAATLGRTLPGPLTFDLAGRPRTVPWSMGAYERD